jgi:hypothetical protein|tara:strand:- start:1445 stop:2113 length:669 start_codon:yes stop_codon:yes gene_type:complete
MAYGKLKADAVIYDNQGSDAEVSISTLAANANKANVDSPTFTGTPAAPTAAQGTNTTQIATTAFVTAAIDPNTAKTDVSQTFGPAQIFTAASVHNGGLDSNGSVDVAGSISIDGPYKQTAEAVSALDIDLSAGNYFTKTINGNSTFTFSNPPASGTVGSFTLELTHTSGTVAWPDGSGGQGTVRFPADTAPTLTTGKTHLFFFVTDDGGTTYRGAALVDYVN